MICPICSSTVVIHPHTHFGKYDIEYDPNCNETIVWDYRDWAAGNPPFIILQFQGFIFLTVERIERLLLLK